MYEIKVNDSYGCFMTRYFTTIEKAKAFIEKIETEFDDVWCQHPREIEIDNFDI